MGIYRGEYRYNAEEEKKVAEDLQSCPTAEELFLRLTKMAGLYAAAQKRLECA